MAGKNPYQFLFEFLNANLSQDSWRDNLWKIFGSRIVSNSLGVTLPDQKTHLARLAISQVASQADWQKVQTDLLRALVILGGKELRGPSLGSQGEGPSQFQEAATERGWYHEDDSAFLETVEAKYWRRRQGELASVFFPAQTYSFASVGEVLFQVFRSFWFAYGGNWGVEKKTRRGGGVGRCACGKYFPRSTKRKHKFCSEQCRLRAKPPRDKDKNRQDQKAWRQREDEKKLKKINEVKRSLNTRNPTLISKNSGIGERTIVRLLTEEREKRKRK